MVKLTAAAAALAVGLGACGSAKVTQTPQARQDEAYAQRVVQGCLSAHGASVISRAGRERVLACVAPPGHEAAFLACAEKDALSPGALLHRSRLYQQVAVCLERNR